MGDGMEIITPIPRIEIMDTKHVEDGEQWIL